ncbi:Crp/Fnr family transcriptional regulator [Rhodoferax sp. GW822-FHT02A01]|uniref:Crp/Fnr family transcriptional regulator n=1 Tax=Rhodoferax sp. GW822-FHT02A01 TaxID=3141537 RepID=UPI00315DCEE1
MKENGNSAEISLPSFLEHWPWYRSLPSELRSLVLNTATERLAFAGEYIARAGDPCTDWYGLMQGILQMYVTSTNGSETTLYCLREGEWGGEGSLLKREPRRYDLRALTPVRLCGLPLKTFELLRNSSIEFNHFLCEIMNTRMGFFVEMLVASRLLGPEVRVAKALMMLADDRIGTTQEILIPQHQLALMCGLSRQRVNMALNMLKQSGLIRSERRRGFVSVHVPRLITYLTAAN